MNIQKIISELLNSGMTQTAIAKRIGCSQSNVSLIHTGKTKRIKFDIGCALIDLAKDRGIEIDEARGDAK